MNVKIHKKKFLIFGAIILIFALAGTVFWFYVDNLAYKVCRVEAGVEVSPSDFLKKADAEAVFTADSTPFDTHIPGEYPVKVKSGLFTHKSTLIIQDTLAPEAISNSIHLEMGETCEAEAFLSEISDATAVTVTYSETPDFQQPGSQKVSILLTDAGGNQTLLTAELFVSQVVDMVTLEAGSEPPSLQDFVIEAREASLLTDMSSLDYQTPGDYDIFLMADGQRYQSLLQIVDTIAPTGQTQNVESFIMVPRAAVDFVTEVNDATAVDISFETEPDLELVGTQEVHILLTDAGANTTILTASLTLEDDNEPPVIKGVSDKLVYSGNSISYKQGVTVTDNSMVELDLSVDASTVNLNEAGVYPVTYSVSDYAGNTATQTMNLTVRLPEYTEEEIYALADNILASIITPDMSLRDKVWEIYRYTRYNIAYINHMEKGSWLEGAYMGMAKKQGDCYAYACTAKALLTRAGITNMDIAKIPAATEHYWNLVDIGDGWYHLDCTPRLDHPVIFLWTDEDMMNYSNTHNLSHNYDHDLYPQVN